MLSFDCLYSLENYTFFFISLLFIFISYLFLFVNNKYKSKIIKNRKKKQNPIFLNNLIITKEYHCPSIMNLITYCYEIYKLNSIQNSIYIAFTIISRDQIKIIKINLSNKSIIELMILKFDNFPKKIKYFYDKMQNKEYLFIGCNKKIVIYYIKTEKKFKKIIEYEQKGKAGGRIISIIILPIYDFEIFFNKFDNNNYLIVTFIYSGSCTSDIRDIKILKFNNNKLNLVNEIKFANQFKFFNSSLFLIWEDNISKKNFLITNIYENLKIIDIFNIKSSFIHKEDKINGFNEHLGENGCIIKKQENDFLYIGDNEGNLRIINLRNKQITKFVIFKSGGLIVFIDNWNEKYIIIGTTGYIYVFNTDINKIISKYLSIFNSGRIHHIETFFYDEYNFYSLCVGGSDKIIRLFY